MHQGETTWPHWHHGTSLKPRDLLKTTWPPLNHLTSLKPFELFKTPWPPLNQVTSFEPRDLLEITSPIWNYVAFLKKTDLLETTCPFWNHATHLTLTRFVTLLFWLFRLLWPCFHLRLIFITMHNLYIYILYKSSLIFSMIFYLSWHWLPVGNGNLDNYWTWLTPFDLFWPLFR